MCDQSALACSLIGARVTSFSEAPVDAAAQCAERRDVGARVNRVTTSSSAAEAMLPLPDWLRTSFGNGLLGGKRVPLLRPSRWVTGRAPAGLALMGPSTTACLIGVGCRRRPIGIFRITPLLTILGHFVPPRAGHPLTAALHSAPRPIKKPLGREHHDVTSP